MTRPIRRILPVEHRADLRVAELDRIGLEGPPTTYYVTPDGKYLLVANHLHTGPANVDEVAAVVSVIDTATGRVVKELSLPNGSGLLNGLSISPDGKYAVVSHILARFHLPTTQLERGWVNSSCPGCSNNIPTDAARGSQARDWPLQEIVRRGYAVASFCSADIDSDRGEVSDGIYAWLATDNTTIIRVVPVGGSAWILGWLLVACGALTQSRPADGT